MTLKLVILALFISFTLQTDNLKCQIDGCAICSFPNVCGLCSKNYVLKYNTETQEYFCQKISPPSHCKTSFQDGICQKCSMGYFLTCQGKCTSQQTSTLQLPQNCLWSSDSVNCSLCSYGFNKKEGKCIRTIPITDGDRHCIVKFSPSICQICQKNYLVSMNGRCVLVETARILGKYNIKLDSTRLVTATDGTPVSVGNYTVCSVPNCESCSVDPAICDICAATYTLNSTKQCQLCNVPGCLQCSQQKNCTTCMQNYQQISSSICLSCMVKNCASCSTANVCQSCNVVNSIPNFPSPTGSQCLPCDKSASGMAGCISCNAPNSCGLCSNGFQLSSNDVNTINICIKCNIQNCQLCGVNTSQVYCQKCALGYSPNNGICNQCQFPCATCNSNQAPNNCATCITPFYFSNPLSNGTCVRNLIPNCNTYNSDNTRRCASCMQSYSLNQTSNSCVFQCQQNCKSCSSSVCKKCQDGFTLAQNGTCFQCQIRGCKECSNDGVSCKKCFKGFYGLSSECKLCPGYCKDCSSSSSCTELAVIRGRVIFIIGQITILAVCQGNCVTCSNLNPWVCLQCSSGFLLKNGNCFKCPSNCLTCDQNNKSSCLSCYTNNFLVNNQCKTCNQKCLTCQGATSVDTCISCRQGFYLSSGDCKQGCPKNCYVCSNLTTCTQCLQGYSLYSRNSQVFCAPCPTSCRTCADGQPALCLSCGTGFYLSGTTCITCTSNCDTCTEGGCNSCTDGYFLTSTLTCAPNCVIPCATCSSTDPTKCNSCIAGYNFNDVSTICEQIIVCNGGCNICPLGYSLKNTLCFPCQASQCQVCNSDNLTQCYSCKPSYYLSDNGPCVKCDSSCKTCLTGNGCLTCTDGYTTNQNLPTTADGYQCIQCNSPCATCDTTPDYCTSCISGYKFFGWKCASKFYFGIQITFLITLVEFNKNYFSLIQLLTGAVGSSDINDVIVISVKEGSVIFEGGTATTAQAGSSQATSQLSALNDLMKSSSISTMPLGASSLTIVNNGVITQPDLSSSQSSSSNNLGIILGICIPLGLLLIIGIILIVINKVRSKNTVEVKQSEYEESAKGYNPGSGSEENNYV